MPTICGPCHWLLVSKCPALFWAVQPQGMKLEQTDRKLKAVAEDARSVDSLEFPSVSGFGGEAASASSEPSVCFSPYLVPACGVRLPAPARGPPQSQRIVIGVRVMSARGFGLASKS